MSQSKMEAWLPLARHGHWMVDYRPDARIVRLRMENGMVLHLDREAYQFLWGMFTMGLDELERLEDESGCMAGSLRVVPPRAGWPQTRH